MILSGTDSFSYQVYCFSKLISWIFFLFIFTPIKSIPHFHPSHATNASYSFAQIENIKNEIKLLAISKKKEKAEEAEETPKER